MKFECVTICSNFVIKRRTEYSFLSQQATMSVFKTAGFLSQNQISELVWDSESEEAGVSSDCIIYLTNRILCIFRQPLKYLCFSYSFLDRVRIYYVENFDSPSWTTYWKPNACRYNGTELNKHRSFAVHDGVACEKWMVLIMYKLLLSVVRRLKWLSGRKFRTRRTKTELNIRTIMDNVLCVVASCVYCNSVQNVAGTFFTLPLQYFLSVLNFL